MRTTRTWKLLGFDGKKYHEMNCGNCRFMANSPKQAVKKSGLDFEDFDVRYSRKGYGYFTGRIEVRTPITIACGENLPADFLLLVVEEASK